MNINISIGESRLPECLLAQMEPGLTESRPSSVASSDKDNEDHTGELWDELDAKFREEEDDFVELDATFREQEVNFVERDESLLGAPGPLFDTPATPTVKRISMPMSPTFSFQHQSAVPSPVSSHSTSPSESPVKLRLRPSSPMRPDIPDLEVGYQPHIPPPHPHVLLPSQRARVVSESARTSPARASPSHRFFASPDQIDALGMLKTWLHSQVISTLGNAFCYTSRSNPRHAHYDILPTDLLDLCNSYMKGHIASRACLSFHFKQAASPSKCCAWLVPVLLEHHWYLLSIDWVYGRLHIYDSLATSKTPHPHLVKFGEVLLTLISEDFELRDCDWDVVPESVSGSHRSLTRF